MTDAPPVAPAADPAAPPAADPAAPPAAVTPRDWMGSLPDDLKSDATLSRFEDVPSLAKSYVELRKGMGNRLAIPAADAGDDAWGPVWNQLGRPDSADGYKFGETVDADAAKAFAPVAHKLGLNQTQAEALAQYDVERMTGAIAEINKASKADLDTLKTELGADYEPKLAAANAAFKAVFGDDAAGIADEMDGRVGSRKFIEGMMTLAAKIGEPPRVDGTGGTGGGVADAEAEGKLKTLQKDAGWREKLNAGDAATVAERQRLLEAAQRHAASGG